jgi:hypothetical protein
MREPVPEIASAAVAVPAEPRRGEGEAGRKLGEVAVDDRLARALGIPGFGLVIPRLTGVLDGLTPADAAYWIATAWCVALAAAIWQGNRWLLFEQRRHWGWFDHPVRKVVALLAAIMLFTAPLTISVLSAWYAWLGQPVRWPVVQTVVLVNVICVIFVTHVYETVFLIKERATDQLRVLALDRARAEAELSAFRAQVDPHFLFNSLNTLGHLIATDPPRASEFNDRLADLHRYVLRHSKANLVTLADELGCLADYVALMKVRFGTALDVQIDDPGSARAARLPPLALQLLVENAIKHNEVGEGRPLAITVAIGRDAVTVRNPSRPRRSARPSAGVGLRNLDERVRYATGRRIAIRQRDGMFEVEVPLA